MHSLEHLTDLKIFEKFKKLTKKNSYIFIEVPNCEINEFYKTRPYDSPHLIFFTKKSLEKILLHSQTQVKHFYKKLNI